ncbi:MAG: hypothetical protein VYC64_17560 [Candidatus Latescibacterota bacterium]|jgi:hypothetical protein|nr:hypothetical protein [Candidatus Latescibacterota bacterium]MED5416755.1 hypothetical protein [Candidatus Latescibacterota bacterium]MEE3261261.1 hypothetical protein [Candidatus Latescibacterota bacterium]MEE3335191.1 hypothetical protein [Candidatus Latescibacterota bacterium]
MIRARHENYTTALSDFVPVIEAHHETALMLVPEKGSIPAF